MKLPFKRVKEMANKMVHIEPPPYSDQVTLCGITDWLGVKTGQQTTQKITCQPCRWIAEYCQSHQKLRALKKK